MELLLVRHADAVEANVDPDRPLSQRGVEEIRRLAKFLHESGWQSGKIFHSGKLRAHQTAGHLLDVAFPNAEVKSLAGLSPMDPLRPIAQLLNTEADNLTLVGHLPFLENLVGLLVTGDENACPINLPTSGAICLSPNQNELWQILWMVVPKLLVPLNP